MNKYRKNYFIWNNKRSRQMKLVVPSATLEYESPSDDVDTVEVPARDGVLHIDKKRIDSLSKVIKCVFIEQAQLHEVTEWLRIKGLNDLILSWDKDYIYKATYTESHSYGLKNISNFDIKFDVYPYKYLASGRTPIVATSIVNPTNYPSKPIYIVEGTGDITLNINGSLLYLKGVQTKVTIDVEKDIIYDASNRDAFTQTETYPFPQLKAGANSITVTAGTAKVTVIPNWRVRI